MGQKTINFADEHQIEGSLVEAIKIYNDPTSQIRVESFLFLICTAWEMAFKTHLLVAGRSIWYKDKRNNKSRTISLCDATRLVLSNERAPLRQNLDAIIGVRNSAQHLVVPEYAYFMNPLFLANIHGFAMNTKRHLMMIFPNRCRQAIFAFSSHKNPILLKKKS